MVAKASRAAIGELIKTISSIPFGERSALRLIARPFSASPPTRNVRLSGNEEVNVLAIRRNADRSPNGIEDVILTGGY